VPNKNFNKEIEMEKLQLKWEEHNYQHAGKNCCFDYAVIVNNMTKGCDEDADTDGFSVGLNIFSLLRVNGVERPGTNRLSEKGKQIFLGIFWNYYESTYRRGDGGFTTIYPKDENIKLMKSFCGEGESISSLSKGIAEEWGDVIMKVKNGEVEFFGKKEEIFSFLIKAKRVGGCWSSTPAPYVIGNYAGIRCSLF